MLLPQASTRLLDELHIERPGYASGSAKDGRPARKLIMHHVKECFSRSRLLFGI
ncbi:MAG: hypothetical protein PHT96_11960 [Syntrophorhabdaceae bacterium]|nr:hypothetical protein [Syntrophorhabdaceae bacterium]MDD4197100.1 hypothetical protein [Syntrophorhabdaceae bacterium]HOC45747.1 hypothetical protein [Syntrophorhabdaceae bacterium]